MKTKRGGTREEGKLFKQFMAKKQVASSRKSGFIIPIYGLQTDSVWLNTTIARMSLRSLGYEVS